MRTKKMRGTFCEKALTPESKLDKRSLRWKRSGKNWLLVGCPRGHYRRGRCTVGTRAAKLLMQAHGGTCARGARRIHK